MQASETFRWQPLFPGIRRKTLAAGEQLMTMLVELDAASVLPAHSHPHEQLTYVLSGRLRMTIAGREVELGPGEATNIPGDTPHSALVLEPTVCIDTFSPPREDLLAIDRGEA